MIDVRSAILISTKLKGFSEPKDVAGNLGVSDAEVGMLYDMLMRDGLVHARPAGLKLTVAGQNAAAQAFASERKGLDRWIFTALCKDFRELYMNYKDIVSDWRMVKTQQGPARNTHRDIAYDDALMDEVFAACSALAPLLDDLGAMIPRCQMYRRRLDAALTALEAGDTRFMADTDVDSIDAIWSELSVDLSAH